MKHYELQMSYYGADDAADDVVRWEASSTKRKDDHLFIVNFRFLMRAEIVQMALHPTSTLTVEFRLYDRQKKLYHYYRPPRGYWYEPA